MREQNRSHTIAHSTAAEALTAYGQRPYDRPNMASSQIPPEFKDSSALPNFDPETGKKIESNITSERMTLLDQQAELQYEIAEVEKGNPLNEIEKAQIRQSIAREMGFYGSPSENDEETGDLWDLLTQDPNDQEGVKSANKKVASQRESERSEERKSLRNPRDLNELLQSIGQYESGFVEQYPLLIQKEGKEYINETNVIRWVRQRMMFFEGEEGPDTPINYFSKIGIRFGTREIHISEMLNDEEKFFVDSNGEFHGDLAAQVRRELFARQIIRGRDILYRTGGKGMADEEGIVGTMQSLFKDNNMTRGTWNKKSMWHWLLEMPLEVRNQLEVHDNHKKWTTDIEKQDTRMGQATATAIGAYYHLADYNKLREMIGENTYFFTREGFERVRNNLANAEAGKNVFEQRSIDQLRERYISDATLDKIFSGGKINATEFIKFVNYFGEASVNFRRKAMVSGLIQEAIGYKYKLFLPKNKKEHGDLGDTRGTEGDHKHTGPELDTQMIRYAEESALFTTRWTGIAAKNDLGGTAYDAQTKWLRFKSYREKAADPNRGSAFGNMYNVAGFKALGVNYLDSIRNQEGKLLREVIEDIARVKPTEVREEDLDQEGNLLPQAEEKKKQENEQMRRNLSELTFSEMSEQSYVNNGVIRWFSEYKSIINADELHIDKLVESAITGKYLYDPKAFGEKIQEGFIKPLRYGYSSWKNLYSKDVRDITLYNQAVHGVDAPIVTAGKKDEKYVFTDMSMAESMFGKQVMDIPQFWMQIQDYDENGKPKVDKYGSPVMKSLEHVIDAARIEDNSVQMFKQMALYRVAADIYSHVDWSSPYPKWDGATIEALINALAIIPGGVLADENDLKNTVMPEYFFSKEDIDYLRSIANVTISRRVFVESGSYLAKEGFSTLRAFINEFIKALK